MCQINTDPMIFQTATLDVNVPPDIGLRLLFNISFYHCFHDYGPSFFGTKSLSFGKIPTERLMQKKRRLNTVVKDYSV